jgi:hypothetical protein
MYIETHPCANSFNPKLSLRFITHPSTLMGCTKIKFSVAWWPKATKFECIPIRKSSRKEATALNINSSLRSNIDHPGYCFTFEPLDGNQDAGYTCIFSEYYDVSHQCIYYREWHHPCENLHLPGVSDSLWYTTWKDMTYEECGHKPNAGAWSVARYHSVSGCFVFFSSPEVWRKPVGKESSELGRCFVLDKVPVFQRCGSVRLLPL